MRWLELLLAGRTTFVIAHRLSGPWRRTMILVLDARRSLSRARSRS